ncbi:hypothetical protein [Celerinatantimonas sp. MCCC 1A17872]|uniref:hypothetical protein n=1 Tax=Celerinatantimonas sp. MCCC 1A17872 TaxID=3177514 RepID=UPI0038C8F30E
MTNHYTVPFNPICDYIVQSINFNARTGQRVLSYSEGCEILRDSFPHFISSRELDRASDEQWQLLCDQLTLCLNREISVDELRQILNDSLLQVDDIF